MNSSMDAVGAETNILAARKAYKISNPSQKNHIREIGIIGRKTGIYLKNAIAKDDDDLDNVDSHWTAALTTPELLRTQENMPPTNRQSLGVERAYKSPAVRKSVQVSVQEDAPLSFSLNDDAVELEELNTIVDEHLSRPSSLLATPQKGHPPEPIHLSQVSSHSTSKLEAVEHSSSDTYDFPSTSLSNESSPTDMPALTFVDNDVAATPFSTSDKRDSFVFQRVSVAPRSIRKTIVSLPEATSFTSSTLYPEEQETEYEQQTDRLPLHIVSQIVVDKDATIAEGEEFGVNEDPAEVSMHEKDIEAEANENEDDEDQDQDQDDENEEEYEEEENEQLENVDDREEAQDDFDEVMEEIESPTKNTAEDEREAENINDAKVRQKRTKKTINGRMKILTLKSESADHADANVRRSHRTKLPPLRFWKNERVRYVQKLQDDIPVPVVAEVITMDQEEDDNGTKSSATATLVRKQLKDSGYKEKKEVTIPIMDFEHKTEIRRNVMLSQEALKPKIVGDHSFKIQMTFSEGDFMTSGLISFPKEGHKPNSNSGKYVLVFNVVSGVFKISIHKSSFIVSAGSQFIVPRGNQYEIQNIGSREGKLFFCHCKEAVSKTSSSDIKNMDSRAEASQKKTKMTK